MFKNKIAISKNFLIAICFISLILFAVNTVNAVDLNDTSNVDTIGIEASGSINAIDEDKLENSQQDMLSQAKTVVLNGGKFSNIQDLIHYNLSDGDTIILNGEFTTDRAESHIIVYKNINFTSTSQAVLDAKNLAGIFVVEAGGSGSSFSNLIFKNGNGLSGGAMFIYGKDITVDNCIFQNNYASWGGGAIYTDYGVEDHPDYGRNLLIKNSEFINNCAVVAAGAVGAYGYNTRILNCLFESNRVYNPNGGYVYGGAIQVGKEEFISNSLIKDCNFFRNKAISVTGSQLSHGGASCLRDGVTYENCLFEENSADFGGALTSHFSGTIKNCTFKSNTANDYGGAISNVDDVTSMNLNIIDCDFKSNSAPYGGAVKLAGNSITIEDCNFDDNYASIDGGAVFVDTTLLEIYDSNFNYNDAEHNGGAIYVNGKSTIIQGSTFRYNTAIANPRVKDDGLGGAIYINGTLASVNNNKFEYNVARNGSAIYYDKSGKDLKITNNIMTKNQAWVYSLPIYANDIYYGESEKIGAIIYGGNNIADYDNLAVSNAIYNAASNRYIKVNGETPVSGATDSGQLYQDSREYNIDVLLTVRHSDGTVVYNNTLKSNYLGEVSKVLNNLKVGTYTVTATHFEDNYYKAISNQTTFVVKSKVDVAVNKETTYSGYNYHNQVVWTINVVNNGPNDATGVKVDDVLPAGLIYQSSTASVGSYSNGVWNIGNLAKSKTATLKITTLVNKTGDITNKATVSATEFDWNTTNNQDSQKISVAQAADLAITKMSNVTTPNYGDLVKWTLTVRNNGPDIAHEVVVSDVIPSGLVIKSASGDYSGGEWFVGTLNVSQSKTLEIVTLVNKTGIIKNTANVSGKEYDYNLVNNNASKSIIVPKAADLSVTKVVNNTTPNFDSLVKWTITVKNLGPDAASGVKVNDVLPSSLIFQSASASVGSYVDGVWTIGNLARGASASLNIVCKVNKTGSIKNTANVSGNEYDINKTNNIANKVIDVPKASDLEIIKSVNNSSPNYHDLVKWTITVKNNGPDDAHNVFVEDILPSGLIIKNTTGNFTNGKWFIGTLNTFSSKTLEIITYINKTGLLTNNANVSGDEYDHNKSNNRDNSSINVPPSTDLEITKIVDIENPLYNSNVKWIVIVKNNGPDRATDVKVNEILSDAFELIRFDASKGYYINGIWTIGDLNIGETVSLELITKIIKTGNFINIVNVTGNEYDYNNSNNQANKSVNVDPAIDLEISKKVSNTYPNYNDLVKWTLTVRNNGPDKANSIEITDILPKGLEFISYNATKGFYSDGFWKFCCLEVGESQTLEIITRIKVIGEIKNIATANAEEYDYNPNNNKDESLVNVAQACDLEIIKLTNQSEVNYKELVKWILTVKNNGPSNATRVVVSESLPEGLTFISAQGDGTYSTTGIWYVGNIASGTTKELTIITRCDATGIFTNVAVVKGDQYDYNPSNDKSEKTITVPPAADLAITKTVTKVQYVVGDLIDYAIEIINNGPDTAKNINVTEIMDDSLEFESAVSASGYYDSIDNIWHIDSLANGEKAFLAIKAIAKEEGFVNNKVSVVSAIFDYNLENNFAECIVEIIKSIIDPGNPFNPGLNSRFEGYGYIVRDLGEIANASIQMKKSGLPIGLLIVFVLISFAFCSSNISKKR